MDKTLREYIKIDEADFVVYSIAKTSVELDDAISKTHILEEHKKNKYHEIVKAKALSLSLLSDIQNLNEFFIKKEIVEEPKMKGGRPKKRDRPRKTKAERVREMKKSLMALKEGLKRR